MSNDLTNGGRPTDLAARLKAGFQRARASTVLTSSQPLLRLQKHGEWVYGQGNDTIQPGSKWVVNTLSLQHGWSCWTNADVGGGKNELLGEQMVSALDEKPVQPEPMHGKWVWKEQFSCDLKCISGEDAGLQVHYKGSAGGTKDLIIGALLPAIELQLDIDPVHICPVVKIELDSYDNKRYGGKTFFPVWPIVGWVDVEGNAPSGPAIAHAQPVTMPAEPPVEPLSTPAARTTNRRRPKTGDMSL